MGMLFEEYLMEIKSELNQEKEIEAMERKETKRRILEHETMYGVGKTLTPIGNLTRTPNKTRIQSKSRLHTPGSVKRLDRLGASSSKRVGKRFKRRIIKKEKIIWNNNGHMILHKFTQAFYL